jgi:MFS family permease
MTAEAASEPYAMAAARPLKRHVAAVVVGNALEFYDFLTYAFFAIYIGQAFFPSEDATSSLLLSLATFGAGFLTRPVGGVVIGSIGDRIGRRPAMFLSFSLMGVAIVGVACTPTYAAIGVAAPLLVLFFRLLQGFALGGEVGPTTAFLIEAPPAHMRGFYGALQSGSQYASTFAAGLVGTGLAWVLSPEDLASWGWRAAFLIGAAIVPFGLLIRRSLPETMPDAEPEAEAAAALMKRHAGDAVFGLLLLAYATVATYVILYLATYAQHTLGMSPKYAFGSTLLIGLCGAIFAPLGGIVSDKIGRRPVMIGSALALLVLAIPSFVLLNHLRSGWALLGLSAILTVVFAFGAAMTIVTTTELMPPRIRSGATATIYALAIATFGGSAQYIVAWLTDRTGDAIAPAYYMSVAIVVGLVTMAFVRETAPAKAKS